MQRTARNTPTLSSGTTGLDFGELVFGQAARLGLLADPVAKALEVLDVRGSEPLVFLHREDHRHLALLAPDHDGFALRGRREPQPGQSMRVTLGLD